MNVVMNHQVPLNAGNVACFLPGGLRTYLHRCNSKKSITKVKDY